MISKQEIAKKLGISRPTLDKYLEEGLPDKYKKYDEYKLERSEEIVAEEKLFLLQQEQEKYAFLYEVKTKELEQFRNEIKNTKYKKEENCICLNCENRDSWSGLCKKLNKEVDKNGEACFLFKLDSIFYRSQENE